MTDQINHRRYFCDRMALLDRLIAITGSLIIFTSALILYSMGAYGIAAVSALVFITLAVKMPQRFRAIKQNWSQKEKGSDYVNFL